jgi:hypothetical protein
VFRKYLPFYLFFLTLIAPGCRRGSQPTEMIDTYHLQYEIKYLEEMAGEIPTKILPRTMDAFFSKHHVYTRIDGFFNQFTLVQIADLKRNQVTTLLDFFGTHVSYTGRPGELPAGVRVPDQLVIRSTGDTATIGGYLSERIEVETTDEQFDIYCTREIRVRHPNISTPYQTVNHPLTEFRIQLSHLKMHLTCKHSEYKAVDSEMFIIPEVYKPVNRDAMEDIINSLFTKD